MKKSIVIGVVAGAAASVAAGITAVVLIKKKKDSEKLTLSNSLNSSFLFKIGYLPFIKL